LLSTLHIFTLPAWLSQYAKLLLAYTARLKLAVSFFTLR
jgi:hypothetical protein